MATRISAGRLRSLLGAPGGGAPAYLWLAERIIELVSDGHLMHGTRLPSERELVSALGISRTTVTRAYGIVRERGFALAQRGSGTMVQVPGGLARGGGEPLPQDFGIDPEVVVADLRSAAPPAPDGLTAAYADAMTRLAAYTVGMGYFPAGLPELREAIADRYTERGAPTDPDQVIVTTGALAGQVAVLHGLLRIGDRIAIESPSYPNTLEMLRDSRMRMVPVPVSGDGADFDGLSQALRASRAMIALPDFHNPTGFYLDDEQRGALADLWRKHDVLGIVDETNVEMWVDDPSPVLPMAAHSPSCVTIGSSAKTYWGGLRIGWVRAPASMVQAIHHARLCLDLGAPVLEQLVVTELLRADGGLSQSSRRALRLSRDALLDLRVQLPDWSVTVPRGGLSLWWHLPAPRSSDLVAAAWKRGVLLASGSSFAVEGHGLEAFIRTPFAMPEEQLRAAVPLIADAWRSIAS